MSNPTQRTRVVFLTFVPALLLIPGACGEAGLWSAKDTDAASGATVSSSSVITGLVEETGTTSVTTGASTGLSEWGSTSSGDSSDGTTGSGLGCGEADDYLPKTHTLHDIDGDGIADLHRKMGDVWKIDFAHDGFGAWNKIISGLDATALPAPADYDGDGRTDIAIRKDDGGWFIDLSGNCLDTGQWDSVHGGYGGPSYHPVPADYDGDKKADFSVKGDDEFWGVDYAANGFGMWSGDVNAHGYGDQAVVAAPPPAGLCADG